MTPVLAAAVALILPVPGGQLTNSFHDARDGGARVHEGVDIMAPRGAPVVAAAAGRVAKLFTSVRGGLCVYQWDTAGRVLVYTHLDRYAPGLADGAALRPGTLLGYVGTSGDAEARAPHLALRGRHSRQAGAILGGDTAGPLPTAPSRSSALIRAATTSGPFNPAGSSPG